MFLNPRFRSSELWDINTILYTIRVKVKGCGPLRRRVCRSLYLRSMILEPPALSRLPPSNGLSRQASQALHLEAFGLRSEPQKSDDKVPPPYQPAIVLKAGISSHHGLLHVGDCLPLRLWVLVPSVVQTRLAAFLKSVRLSMVDPSLARNSTGRVVRAAGTFIREVQLQIPLQRGSKQETFEVDPASWRDCRVPRSLSIPGSGHELEQPYLLQLLCEFSCSGMTGNIVSYPPLSGCKSQ